MATRSTPTERQKRLGSELRKMRLSAGVTTEYAAGLLGIDRTRLSNMESGIRPFSADRIRTLACNYSCSDTSYVEALTAMAEGKERGWWEQYRGTLSAGLLDIAELEWHAARVRTAQVMHVPGLLQTENYARAVFSAVLPPLSRLEVELRVVHRMKRQQVFERSEPLPYLAYVHEAALRMPYGGTKVTLQQLEQIVVESERPSIDVRVIPYGVGDFPGQDTPCCMPRALSHSSTPCNWTRRMGRNSPARRHSSPSTVLIWTGWTTRHCLRRPREMPSAASPVTSEGATTLTSIDWEDPFCGEGNNCFRIGTDTDDNAYIAVAGQEGTPSPTPGKPSATSSSRSSPARPTTCCRTALARNTQVLGAHQITHWSECGTAAGPRARAAAPRSRHP